ncbi:MAG: arylsulfatase [Planctomycetes bacterium]|nr:arylsulfatase [Planctomycetota bacterium]
MKRRVFLKSCFVGLGGFGVSGLVSDAAARTMKVREDKKTNVLFILADDMGYSDAECYGGDVKTPNLSALAAGGVRYTQHYSTGRCWPSRACILTGYYAQQCGRDPIKGIYKSKRPVWAPLLPEMLKPYGYKSYHTGKWHLDGTPKAAGFDRAWGTGEQGLQCDENRFFNSKRWQEDGLSAPVKQGQPYYSTVAIADHAIACLKLHKKNHPSSPFFQYTAFYSPHFPLHAMQKDIDKYRDAYLEGWDVIRDRRLKKMKELGLVDCKLSERQTDVVPVWNLSGEKLKSMIGDGEAPRAVAWDSLTDEQKKFQATKMAIHAAMIDRMDAEIGRIVKQLKDMGEFENTLILFASDNGASAEQIIRGDEHSKYAAPGSAKSYLCLGPGWATAANTPFKLHKHWNHEGGISSPLIAHWPKGIKDKGKLRHDVSHFIDIAPTILHIASGIANVSNYKTKDAPKRPGISLLESMADGKPVEHESLWWYHHANRAIRMGDWKLSSRYIKPNQLQKWELYNIKEDRSEMNDLAAKHPEIVAKLNKQWEETAEDFRKHLKGYNNPQPRRRKPRKKKE